MITDVTQHIGVLIVSIHIPAAQSLKDKRMVLRSVKAQVANKFNVSVSELDQQDKWQVAILGFAMISNDNRLVDAVLQNILSFLQTFATLEVCEHAINFY